MARLECDRALGLRRHYSPPQPPAAKPAFALRSLWDDLGGARSERPHLSGTGVGLRCAAARGTDGLGTIWAAPAIWVGEEGPGDPRESPTGVFAPESKQLTPLCRYPADDIKPKEANEREIMSHGTGRTFETPPPWGVA